MSDDKGETEKLINTLSLPRSSTMDSGDDKLQPPFPNLPCYLITAIILSYYGYSSKVCAMLKMLSKRCNLFAESKSLRGLALDGVEPRRPNI